MRPLFFLPSLLTFPLKLRWYIFAAEPSSLALKTVRREPHRERSGALPPAVPSSQAECSAGPEEEKQLRAVGFQDGWKRAMQIALHPHLPTHVHTSERYTPLLVSSGSRVTLQSGPQLLFHPALKTQSKTKPRHVHTSNSPAARTV